MTVELIDSVSYNQVASKEMFSYFKDGEIEHNEAKGNVYVVYFLSESDGSRIGMNYAETAEMKMYMNQRKVHKIWMPQAQLMMYPDLKIPSEKRYLQNFAWFDYIRPKNKDDIFDWRGKDEKSVLKKSEKKVVPLQSLQNL